MSRLFKTVTAVSITVILSACSGNQESKRQITGNENYLNTPDIKPLNAPAGMTLPLQFGDFSVPNVQTSGEVGKALDIRPPLQPLALMAGSRAQAVENQAEIRFESSGVNLGDLMQSVFKSRQYQVTNAAAGASGGSSWTTDKIGWQRKDEKNAYDARYEISAVGNGYSNIIHVRLLELTSNGETVTDTADISRYTVMMLNSIVEGIYTEQNRQSAQAAAEGIGSFVVQSATDETGLPLIMVRSPYAVVWQALPGALGNVGMTISESNRANGLISLKYKALSKDRLETLTAPDVKLKSGEYTLQVGDLGNRTSLQFRSSKGQPIDGADNESLVALMQAAFNLTKLD